MKHYLGLITGLCLLWGTSGLCGAQSMEGVPLEVRPVDQTKKLDHISIKGDPKYGLGFLDKLENVYTAEIRNTSPSGPIGVIKLRLVSFFSKTDSTGKQIGFEVGTVQVRNDITLAASESRRVEFDVEDFQKGKSKIVNGNTITFWTLGKEYEGLAMEIYINGTLMGRRLDGGQMHKAYDEWFAKNGEDKTASSIAAVPAPAADTPVAPADGTPVPPAPVPAEPVATVITPVSTAAVQAPPSP